MADKKVRPNTISGLLEIIEELELLVEMKIEKLNLNKNDALMIELDESADSQNVLAVSDSLKKYLKGTGIRTIVFQGGTVNKITRVRKRSLLDILLLKKQKEDI